VFDLEERNGGGAVNELRLLAAGESVTDDFYGFAVAIDGRRAVIGAPARSDAGFASGAAYVVDVVTGAELAKLSPSDGAALASFGSAVAISGNQVLVGAREAGKTYLFELADGVTSQTETLRLDPGDLPTGASTYYGVSTKLCGNRALIGAAFDGLLAVQSGAAYLIRDLVPELPLASVAKRTDFAPGVVNAEFGSFREAFVDPAGSAAVCAGLTGPGSNRNRDKGIWAQLPLPPHAPLERMISSRMDLSAIFPAGVMAGAVQGLSYNGTNLGFARIALAGTGITSRNNGALISYGANGLKAVLQTGGTTIFGGGGAEEILRFADVAQARTPDLLTVAYTMRIGSGAIFSGNDTGVLSIDSDGLAQDTTPREGSTIPGDPFLDSYGQFLGRAVQSRDTSGMLFPCFRVPFAVGTPVVQLVQDDIVSNPTTVVMQGDPAPSIGGGVVFQSFLGETMTAGDVPIYRTTLSGPGVTRSNNEVLWTELGGTRVMVRKGAEVNPAVEPGVKVSRLLGYWTTDSLDVYVLLKLSGTGITRANDCALYRWDSATLTMHRLIGEGDPACGCDGARVGVIQRVSVGHDSRFMVLCSLVGGSKAANQALFSGNGDGALPDALRLPYLALRKGSRYHSRFHTVTGIRSLNFSLTHDRTGAGGKGLGEVINGQGVAALMVTFDNRAVEVMTGKL
ncbi:MAG: FG-GAP repeat protein, partial [Verrucomicrobiae bacterium]|nr:FG-GAP repeat protein [Verrucomicrobiae bacterium]